MYSNCPEIACPQAAEDIKALVGLAAALSVAHRDQDNELSEEAWHSLPDHLLEMVNAEVEKLLPEEVPHGN